jgi:hypothetical protein
MCSTLVGKQLRRLLRHGRLANLQRGEALDLDRRPVNELAVEGLQHIDPRQEGGGDMRSVLSLQPDIPHDRAGGRSAND